VLFLYEINDYVSVAGTLHQRNLKNLKKLKIRIIGMKIQTQEKKGENGSSLGVEMNFINGQ